MNKKKILQALIFNAITSKEGEVNIMNNIPMELIQMIKNGGNPQQLMLNMLEKTAASNPILGNLLSLAKNNDKKGIEDFARNMMKEQGKDFDTEFNAFRQSLGL